MISIRYFLLALLITLPLQGCKTLATTLGAVVGGAIGVAAADQMAEREGKRKNLTPQQIEALKKNYRTSFALIGAVGGGILTHTIYDRLKEDGRRQREQALVNAAAYAQPQRYGEPSDPTLSGNVVPQTRYVDTGGNRECIDLEDSLADANGGDRLFVKMCRSVPSGTWQQVTS